MQNTAISLPLLPPLPPPPPLFSPPPVVLPRRPLSLPALCCCSRPRLGNARFQGCGHEVGSRLAVGETVILLHPPLP